MGSSQLLHAISATDLIAYFEFLDGLRESARTNMWGAPAYLRRNWRGMTPAKSYVVADAWRSTFTETLPAEDRAMNALERA
jgi:hypothetical protein